ncbi:hypothetical protein [Prescottella agglutinans]|uniref:Xanthine dehydrogenase iron-sulfur cluster and FAD-binding subunit A n=1 Tax=Prescottella agglutinans TaxID=1644129 RepID=A0ABT6MHZ3_9NOCA|nr:hypothetical protein [Prescottella agglutinans]MDH6283943.1 xanthine dehydrogenase iron-sulfur cluster and FAD-binding subunit A [Prescottella agglutinans]
MPTTVRTETDTNRSYMHTLVATDGTHTLTSVAIILPGTAAIELVRTNVETTLTGQPLTDQSLADAVDSALEALDA